jgi:hypothetical protein
LHPIVGAADINQHITAVGNVNGERIGVIECGAAYTEDIDIVVTSIEGNAPIGDNGGACRRIACKGITTAFQIGEFARKVFRVALIECTAEGDTGDIGVVGIHTIAVVDLTIGIGQVISHHQNIAICPNDRVKRYAYPIVLQSDIPPCRQASFGIGVAGGKVVAYIDVIVYGFAQRTLG